MSYDLDMTKYDLTQILKKKYSIQTRKFWLGVNSVHALKKLKDPPGPLETEAKAMKEALDLYVM